LPTPFGTFSSPHPVGLFDASGNLLASSVIDNSSQYGDSAQPLINSSPTGNFVFNRIAGVTLQASQTYVVEGVSNLDPYTSSDPAFKVYLPITVLGNNWVLDNGLNFNGTFLINDVNNGYWGANFGVGPEPGSLVLFGSGILGLAAVVHRKLKP
jgi:PEP-CTERM motif